MTAHDTTDYTADDFAAYMRAFRVRAEMTQQELADKCERDRTFISLIEHRRRHPSADTVDLICRALHLSREEWDMMLDLAGYRPRSLSSLMNLPRLGVLDDMYPRLPEESQRELRTLIDDRIDVYEERLIA